VPRRPPELIVRRSVVPTPVGDAWVDLDTVSGSRRLLIAGHGAGGGVDAADLRAVGTACRAAGISVAMVTQPYRVAGRKAPPPAEVLDTAWNAVVAVLVRRRSLAGHELVYAGRSSGARIACRTATLAAGRVRPIAVVALAFPVHPPGRPDRLRTPELAAVPVPVLVVQGDRDPFGQPDPVPGRDVRLVPGDHSLSRSAGRVGALVADWLLGLPSA
jgi:predicted alpha/beta-hydrolase family hydrolase